MAGMPTLREVDGAEIVSLADDSVDFVSTMGRKGVYQVRDWVERCMGACHKADSSPIR